MCVLEFYFCAVEQNLDFLTLDYLIFIFVKYFNYY
jgi:hypothetical protein